MPAVEEMFTIDPPPLSRIAGAAVFMPRKAPTRLIDSTFMKCSTVESTNFVNAPSTPALFTRMFSPPYASTVSRTASCQLASDVTSSVTNTASSPRSCATASPSASRMSPITTLAPSATNRRACDSPCPRAPPLMSATFPSSRPTATPFPGTDATDALRLYQENAKGSRLFGSDDPHGEELGAAAVGVSEGDLGPVDLVLTGLAAHLHRRLGESKCARRADRIGRQHAATHVDRQVAVHLRRTVLHHPPPLTGVGDPQVLEPHRLEPRERHVHLDAVDLVARIGDARLLVHVVGALDATQRQHRVAVGG